MVDKNAMPLTDLASLCQSGEIRDEVWDEAFYATLWRALLRADPGAVSGLSHWKQAWEVFTYVLSAPEVDLDAMFAAADVSVLLVLLSVDDPVPGRLLYCAYKYKPSSRVQVRTHLGKMLRTIAPQLTSGGVSEGAMEGLNACLRLTGNIVAGMNVADLSGRAVCTRLLHEVVLPLHAPNGMILWRDQCPVLNPYHKSLVFLVVMMVQRFDGVNSHRQEQEQELEESFLVATVRGLLKQWPKGFSANTPKEVLFLHEVDTLLRLCGPADFCLLLPGLTDLLSRVLAHDNAVPMQRALEFFRNDAFVTLCRNLSSEDKVQLASTLLRPLYRGGQLHWSPTVNKMTAASIQTLQSIADPDMFTNSVMTSLSVKSTGFAPPDKRQRRLPPGTATATTSMPLSAARPTLPRTTAGLQGEALEVLADYVRRCQGPNDPPESKDIDAETDYFPSLRFHDLVFGKELGRGAFSVVKFAKRVVREKPQSRWPEYAVKVISKGGGGDLDSLLTALKEIALLRSLRHPLIACLRAAFRYNDCAYLALDYAAGGDLHSYVMDNGALDEPATAFVAAEVSCALLFLHEQGLAFNDLKPENVLLCATHHVKLTDFGGCRPITTAGREQFLRSRVAFEDLADGDWKLREQTAVSEEAYASCVERVVAAVEGTPAYLPPEGLRAVAHGYALPADFDSRTNDAWALGCLVSFSLNGRPLFFGSAVEVLDQMQQLLTPVASQVRFVGTAGSIEATSARECLYHGSRVNRTDACLALLDGLLLADAHSRWSLLTASESDFVTRGGTANPRLLHLGPGLALPVTMSPRAVDNSAWARRQLSVVWAPMPAEYSFAAAPTTRRAGESRPEPFQETAIEELATEAGHFI